MMGPVQAGAEDQAVGKCGFTRSRHETVDVFLPQDIIRGVQLALDGVEFSGSPNLGH
ncbi:hypothetical protein FEMY_21020 [Ferrovum myxofaciens]|uniref:Uncharacterized protein n=1 Tax=Ferrovum myxofaciens TaxID=416213 RepID=A0A149VVX5_9PROT|nr:hypothetical protein FEMY_21020 [Ferrovum myxofaciens]